MIYFDSSYILKCYLNEPQAHLVRELASTSETKCCSIWGRVEFFSGIKRQKRENKITIHHERRIFEAFIADEKNGVWKWFPIDAELLNRVCEALKSLESNIYLRSADALHLICAREYGFHKIYSSDRHLLAAASCFGLEGQDILPKSFC